MFRHVTTRLSGLVILIAGLWGGLIPFVGPYFHFVLGPDQHWKWTTGRLWLDVVPGAVAVLGGLILMGGGPRASGRFGALLALAAGIWFAIGPDVSMLWNHGVSQAGVPHARHSFKRMLEFLTFHSGLGVLITAFAAYALPGAAGYVAGRRRVERDAALAGAGGAAGAAEAGHRERVAEREETARAGAGAGTGGAPVTREPVGDGGGAGAPPAADREVAAPGQGETAAGPGQGETAAAPGQGETAAAPGHGAAATTAQAGPRRRGGLAGFFSRR